MIKLSKHLYIHWLTVLFFVSAYISRTLEITCIMYSVMLLHELAHTAAAFYLKLGISRIILYPFGVSLTVRSRILCSLSDSLILYLAGPFVNVVIAAIAAVFGVCNLFTLNNIAVFLLNILPIIPLDGGRIAEAVLIRNVGERKCRIIMSVISAFLSVVLTAILFLSGSLNINSATFVAFLLGGCIMQKPKYNRDLIREITLSKKKTIKSNIYVIDDDIPKRKIVSYFNPKKRSIVFICDKSGAVKEIKTDTEVIFDILN
ncbi:MAG: hypothetical protein UIM24_00600 [Clostridia bacterium]|nr:hypothetical protein [Clostridia bacterium]